ncbi:MAG: hypothetical protein QOG13_1355 [Sphingomonadales bacterium]|nr:hypothetical protein [Sphingomonadales bacterium]MEA3043410.1 hypothetical protein [Sphingomonadales bacterium]
MIRASCVLLWGGMVSACVSLPDDRDLVFARPQEVTGRSVRVCGFMIDSANIVESSDRDDSRHSGGLTIVARGPLNAFHRGRVCVEGNISYVGCVSGPTFCTDSAYDYGISVRRLLPLTVTACARGGCSNVASQAPSPYRPSAVVGNIDHLRGRRVRIDGYLILGQDTRALWDSRSDAETVASTLPASANDIWNHCITAYYQLSLGSRLEQLSGSDVSVEGTIGVNRNEDDEVDLWSCNDVYVNIDRIVPRHADGPAVAQHGGERREGVAFRRPSPVTPRDRRVECSEGPFNGCGGD